MRKSEIRVRSTAERTFFKFGPDYGNPPHGLVLINQAAYDADRVAFHNDLRDRPDPERRLQRRSQIFPLSETPRFRLDPTLGGWPADLHIFNDYWLVSDRLKQALERFDPGAMYFVRCDVLVPAAGDHVLSDVPVWIGSVVRQVEVDEAASRVRIKIESDGSKTYNLMGSTRLVFVADSVHERHLFRIPYTLRPFCDDSLVSLLEQGGFTGWSLGGQV